MPVGPLLLRGINAVGEALSSVGLGTSLDANEIVRAARKETGLDDFGGDDWQEPLELLVAGASTEAGLTLPGARGGRDGVHPARARRRRR